MNLKKLVVSITTRAEEKARSFHVNQRTAFARDINGYICFCLIEIYNVRKRTKQRGAV